MEATRGGEGGTVSAGAVDRFAAGGIGTLVFDETPSAGVDALAVSDDAGVANGVGGLMGATVFVAGAVLVSLPVVEAVSVVASVVVLLAVEVTAPPELLTDEAGASCASCAAACAEPTDPEDPELVDPGPAGGVALDPETEVFTEPVDALDPLVDAPDDSPESSACAVPTPLTSAAPTPSVTTPAPSH